MSGTPLPPPPSAPSATADEEVACAVLALLLVRDARQRGSPAAIGVYVAQMAGTPLGGIAFKAGQKARAMFDAEERRR